MDSPPENTETARNKSDDNIHEIKEEIKFSDLKELTGSFWILACIIMLSEALFVPFLDNGNAFI